MVDSQETQKTPEKDRKQSYATYGIIILKKTNDLTVKFLDMFQQENGSYICRELLGCDLATEEGKLYAREKQLFVEFCPKMVESATMIAEKLLNS